MTHCPPSLLALTLGALLIAAPALGRATQSPPADALATGGEDDSRSPESARRLVETIRPGLVRVEHHLRQHQGERPDTLVGRFLCASCGQWHREDADKLIDDERPLETGGFLLEPDLVLASDPAVHERFVDRIRVRAGDDIVSATVERWARDDSAVLLRLERPLRNAVPLTVAQEGTDATWMVQWSRSAGTWSAEARPYSVRVSMSDGADPAPRTIAAPNSLLLDADGRVAGATFRGSTFGAQKLNGDPREWRHLDQAARKALLTKTAERADAGILRASLRFRSPRKRQGAGRGYDPYSSQAEGVGTELETLAIVLDDERAAVMAILPPSTTARLEGIVLHAANGDRIEATFESSLRDLGVVIARLSAPATGSVPLSSEGILEWRDELLPAALVRMAGRQRAIETGHVRLERFETGWRGEAFPSLVAEVDRTFVFSPDGELVALPLVRRVPPSPEARWRSDEWKLTPASILAAALEAGEGAIDPSNTPLSEELESRTAWLGVIMQSIDGDLADAMGVSELTNDGEFGGLVASVYPDSPAARAGIAPGQVILAIHAPTRPRPIQIVVDESEMGYPGAFPWERLDEVPEEYFDQVPTPWPTIEDLTARTLAELGFGVSFDLEYYADGQVKRVPMTVEHSPPHFGNAPRHEDERLGVTVRDLSFEIRNHLRMAADEPGVVISSLKPGGRASLAGLRPFEIIVEVDGQPISDAAAFGELVADKTDLRLTVRRGTRSRAVRMTVE